MTADTYTLGSCFIVLSSSKSPPAENTRMRYSTAVLVNLYTVNGSLLRSCHTLGPNVNLLIRSFAGSITRCSLLLNHCFLQVPPMELKMSRRQQK